MADDPDQSGTTPSLTEAEFERWITPAQALSILNHLGRITAAQSILTHLRAVRFRACAETISQYVDGETKFFYRSPFPPKWWSRTDADNSSDSFWTVGDITIFDDDMTDAIYFTDIRFDPAGIEKLRTRTSAAQPPMEIPQVETSGAGVPKRQQVSQAPEPLSPVSGRVRPTVSTKPPLTGRLSQAEMDAIIIDAMARGPRIASANSPLISGGGYPNKGGRPRKEFWEPLLIAAGIAIYDGFQPKRISDVEHWMNDWLVANDHSASEGAVRDRARALFNAFVAQRDKN
jgi:hypothetical protein